MPLFVCNNPDCDAIENTASSFFWSTLSQPPEERNPQCSACDPDIGKWHDRFPRQKVTLQYLNANRRHFYWLPQRWLESLGETRKAPD